MKNWRNLLPDRYLSLGVGFAALVILTILCLPAIGARIGYYDPTTQTFAHNFFGALLVPLAASKLVSLLVQATFWGSIGFAVYLLTWVAANATIELRNQASMTSAYVNRSSWASVMKRPLEHLSVGLLLLAVTAGVIMSMKFWADLGVIGIASLPSLNGLFYLLGAALGITVGLFVVAVLWRLTKWVASGRS